MVAGVYGSLLSTFGLIGFFFWGHFLDRFRKTHALSAVYFIACGMPLIYLISRDLWLLGIAQAIAGFTYAAMELIGYVAITLMASHKEVPRYMAVHIAFGGLRGGVAPFLGTAIMSTFGASTTFGLSLFLILLGFFLAICNNSEKQEGAARFGL